MDPIPPGQCVGDKVGAEHCEHQSSCVLPSQATGGQVACRENEPAWPGSYAVICT